LGKGQRTRYRRRRPQFKGIDDALGGLSGGGQELDTHAPTGSIAFRTFDEYSKISRSHTAAEAFLAHAGRLLMDGEDAELERGP
jgi:hypothetical protein